MDPHDDRSAAPLRAARGTAGPVVANALGDIALPPARYGRRPLRSLALERPHERAMHLHDAGDQDRDRVGSAYDLGHFRLAPRLAWRPGRRLMSIKHDVAQVDLRTASRADVVRLVRRYLSDLRRDPDDGLGRRCAAIVLDLLVNGEVGEAASFLWLGGEVEGNADHPGRAIIDHLAGSLSSNLDQLDTTLIGLETTRADTSRAPPHTTVQ